MAESDAEDRTQAPSERKLAQARESGQAPLSREVITWASLAGAALLMAILVPGMTRRLGTTLQEMLAADSVAAGPALTRAAWAWSEGAMSFLVVAAIAGAASVLLQTNFLIHGAALAPDISRISPGKGLKRIFGGTNLVESLKAIIKLALFAWAFWRAMASVWPSLGGAAHWTVPVLLDRLGREFVHLMLLIVGVQTVVAMADMAWTRWRFQQRLRMSREDVKDEMKEADGDPWVKGRLRQIRQARARRRMMAAVAKATVVITNPTHYAVALAYERGTSAAPRIVAKGVDSAAARIRAAAEKAGVPLVANPPLARALYLVPLDAEVPGEHFKMVAEVIAYVWRLRGSVAR